MSKEVENWIYRNPAPEYEPLFEAIEAALGFKLFIWQKTFIITGNFRQYGETTARILKDLLDLDKEPIDYTRPPTSNREQFYRHELRVVKEKLVAAGIMTRAVFWSKKDKEEYSRMKNSILLGMEENERKYAAGFKTGIYAECEKPDCIRCPFPPCRKGGARND